MSFSDFCAKLFKSPHNAEKSCCMCTNNTQNCRIIHTYRVSDKRGDQGTSTTAATSADGKTSVVFDFDQVDRHRKFWEFLRAKEWQAVATFLDKKVINSTLQPDFSAISVYAKPSIADTLRCSY